MISDNSIVCASSAGASARFVSGYRATTVGTRPDRAACDMLPGYPLAGHIDDFLAPADNHSI